MKGGVDVLLAAARKNLDLCRRNLMIFSGSLSRDLKSMVKNLEAGEESSWPLGDQDLGERALEIALLLGEYRRTVNLVRELEAIQ